MTQHVLITGGASGLGLALARRYLAQGDTVLICDMNQQAGEAAVEALKKGDKHNVSFLPCDITRQADIDTLVEHVKSTWGKLDILVNNAGVATGGALKFETIEQWEWVLNINLLGLVRMSQSFVDLLQDSVQGHIVNIASQAGLTPIPVMGSYNASKAAVVSFSETMHLELCHKNIGVSVVCPSFFATNLDKSLRTSQPGITELLAKLFSKSSISADEVADIVVKESAAGRFMILTHKAGKLAYRLKRFLPTSKYLNNVKEQTRALGKLCE